MEIVGTQVFAVLDRLVADLTMVTAQDDQVVVLDGPTVSGDMRAAIAVGVPDPGSSSAAVSVARTGPGGLTSHDQEQWSIGCSIGCSIGEGGHGPTRARVQQLFGVVQAHLRQNPTLGGTAMNARVGSWELWQLAGPQGSELLLHFQVVGFGQM